MNSFNPLMFNPLSPRYNMMYSPAVTYYYLNRYSSPAAGYADYPFGYPTITAGNSPGRPTGYLVQSTYDALGRAQQAAGEPQARALDAKNVIENQPVAPDVAKNPCLPGPVPPDLARALALVDPAEAATGEPLNLLVVAIQAAEGKCGKGVSPHIPTDLLRPVRFAGPSRADAVNQLRQDAVGFPAAFDAPVLAILRPTLDDAYKAATAPVLAGKAADPAKVTALEKAVALARSTFDTINPAPGAAVVEGMRQFLARMGAVVEALRRPDSASLLVPRWRSEGTDVAELIKYLAAHKFAFGPAPRDGEEAYLSLHRKLVFYFNSMKRLDKK